VLICGQMIEGVWTLSGKFIIRQFSDPRTGPRDRCNRPV
jgi:hypothetical protein